MPDVLAKLILGHQVPVKLGQYSACGELLFDPAGNLTRGGVLGGKQHTRVLARVVYLPGDQQPAVLRLTHHIIRQEANAFPEDLALAFGREVRYGNHFLAVQQPAHFLINRRGGVFHHDIGVEPELAFGDGLLSVCQRMSGRNGELPADGADFGVVNPASAQQGIRCADGDIDLIINHRIPDAVIDLGRDGYLAAGEALFKDLQQPRRVARGVQQMVNTNSDFGLNPLRNGIYPPLNALKIIQQVSGFTVEIKPGFGQLNIAGVADKQRHVERGFYPLDSVADSGSGETQLFGRPAEAALARGAGKCLQILFGKD